MNVVSLRDAALSRVRQPRQILLALALAFASTLALTIALPAHAQPQRQAEAKVQAVIGCPANRICLYPDIKFGGRPAVYATGSSDMSRFGPPFNDKTSSIWNNTGARWCAYEHADYRGRLLVTVQPGPRQSVPWVGAAANDQISSLRKC